MAELALKRLLATPPSAVSFRAKVTTLKELIEHHVEEEEEELFPLVEKRMGDDTLLLLGKQMKVAFDAAFERGFEELVPRTMSSTSADVSNKAKAKKNGQGRSTSASH